MLLTLEVSCLPDGQYWVRLIDPNTDKGHPNYPAFGPYRDRDTIVNKLRELYISDETIEYLVLGAEENHAARLPGFDPKRTF